MRTKQTFPPSPPLPAHLGIRHRHTSQNSGTVPGGGCGIIPRLFLAAMHLMRNHWVIRNHRTTPPGHHLTAAAQGCSTSGNTRRNVTSPKPISRLGIFLASLSPAAQLSSAAPHGRCDAHRGGVFTRPHQAQHLTAVNEHHSSWGAAKTVRRAEEEESPGEEGCGSPQNGRVCWRNVAPAGKRYFLSAEG